MRRKQNKRYNNFFDNYKNKVGGTVFLGFVYVVIGVVAYLIYTLLQ
ncbi:hypothetical protein RXV94_00005 [Yeosuana sp. MJ-SS3]|jgi:hypothetical protein|uniref:Uncharacterized protein n=1 Tax=Gilvirhabdus luticola TaxID=3079858 RepID=A0ABU3U281_9FLAO|nr:hypothetical protein [Yeosuana sp. MJ-SS3]MDU8884522.1 hypothetical protein [Yeosuana sp. MJ-SS3]